MRDCTCSPSTPLVSHFFPFKRPLKAEKWLRAEEQSAFLATGRQGTWLGDGGAGRDVPSGSGCCTETFQGFFAHGSRLKGENCSRGRGADGQPCLAAEMQ